MSITFSTAQNNDDEPANLIVPKRVHPFYIVVDESASMQGAPIDAVNAGIKEMLKEQKNAPASSGYLYISLIGFSDTAVVHLPMQDLPSASGVEFEALAGTQFGPAFELLYRQIPLDIENIRNQGMKPMRPFVFFISDGMPLDEESNWRASLDKLTTRTFTYYPLVWSFGFGDIDENTIRKIATVDAYLPEMGSTISPASVLTQVLATLTKTMLGTVRPALESDGAISIPRIQVPGMIRIDPL